MRFSFANGENKRREAILPPAETAFLSRATFSPLLRVLFSRGSSRKAWNFEQRTSCAWSSCTWRYSSSPQSSACSVSSDFFRSEKSERVIYNTAPRSCQGAFARFRCFLRKTGSKENVSRVFAKKIEANERWAERQKCVMPGWNKSVKKMRDGTE